MGRQAAALSPRQSRHISSNFPSKAEDLIVSTERNRTKRSHQREFIVSGLIEKLPPSALLRPYCEQNRNFQLASVHSFFR